jgi:hypothetical protein
MNQYPNSGSFNPNKYKTNPKHPDYKGSIKIDRAVILALLKEQTDPDEIEIKLAMWEMQGARGPWMRVSWDNYRKPEESKPAPKQADIEDEGDVPF